MKIKLLFATIGVLIGTQSSIAKEWRGIVPLKSKRTEVESRFGKPDKWGDYYVDHERVSFRFSEGGSCTDLYRALGACRLKSLSPLSGQYSLEFSVSDMLGPA